ncbi:sigma-54-dependent transcriptional regulator [Verrucomicrobiota bacterium sgz303538]
MKRTILLVEDDSNIASALRGVLETEDYIVLHAETGDRGLADALRERCDLVLTDLRLPGLSGLELVQRLHAAKPQLPIVLMTAHGTTETAIEATKRGAYDYLLKPFEMPELLDLIAKALASSRLAAAGPVTLGDESAGPGAIVGQSRAMQSIYKEIGRIAARNVTVLIRGETGTGKELIARAIFQHSDRAGNPFIAINCAAIPEQLLESELFGHERGAFTGAETRRIGRFEQAHGGTLFLDEIGELSPGTQAKLLRVLQERAIQRLGGKDVVPVDVRMIAATHRDLEAAIAERQFREDLFYRLNVMSLTLPPLRARAEDIPPLVDYFLRRYAAEFDLPVPALQPEALQLLCAQSWPGNVRELENVVRKALLAARGLAITVEVVQSVLGGARPLAAGTGRESLADFVGELLAAASRGELESAHAALIEVAERELLAQAMKLAGGNQAKAARWIGISRLTLREKLQRFGLHPTQEGPAPGAPPSE